MSNYSESKLNRIFVDLEAAYIKKAKYVKIINTMKHSNIPYWKSIQMDHPIYSLKQAEYEVKRWETHYHGQIVKHINNFTIMKPETNKMISLHSLTRKDLIDLVANNLKLVQRARRHYAYVQKIYNDYKVRLEDINNKIKSLKQEIITTIIYTDTLNTDVGATCSGCTCGEIEDLEQAITDTYGALEYNNTPPLANNVIRANPEDCKIALFNIKAKEDCTPIATTERPKPKPKTYNTPEFEVDEYNTDDSSPYCGPTTLI